MKKITILSLSLMLFSFVKAGVLTVDNNPGAAALYTTIPAAVTAANSGDTILVVGSASIYGGVSILDKEIHLVGVGYKPNKDIPVFSRINGVTFGGTNATQSSSNSSMTGIKTSNLTIQGTVAPSFITKDITIKRCDIGIILFQSNILNINIRNNRISSITNNGYYSMGNIIIANNIVTSNIRMNSSTSGQNVGQVIIKNNNFISGSAALSIVNNCIFSNNIFYGASPFVAGFGSTFCTYTNNLSYNNPTNNNFNLTGTNTGSGNLVNQNPNFVSPPTTNFVDVNDLNTPNTSPVHNAGTDGTDIGIYGGSYPWPEGGISGSGFMYSQEPQYPQVNQMNVLNIAVPQNGTLNVTVKGIKND